MSSILELTHTLSTKFVMPGRKAPATHDDDDDLSSSSEGTYDSEESVDEMQVVRDIHSKENRNVLIWRELILGMFAIVGTVLSVTTYVYLAELEKIDQRNGFTQIVNAIEGAATTRENILFESLYTISDSITADAIKLNMTWPFVTVPYFEIQAHHARHINNLDAVAFSPLVIADDMQDWIDYSVENQGWLTADVILNENEQLGSSIRYLQDTNFVPTQIHTVHGAQLGIGPYSPVWQISPMPFDASFVNFDLISDAQLNSLFLAMMDSRSFVFSEVMDFTGYTRTYRETAPFNESAVVQFYDIRIKDEILVGGKPGPESMIFYPIFENYTKGARVVAIEHSLLLWDTYVQNILPDGVDGVYCIIHSSAGQNYTYVATQGEIFYIGPGDLHDPFYDDYEAPIDLFTSIPSESASRGYTYKLVLYPTSEFQENYRTWVPSSFAGFTAISFLAMGCVFLIYHKLVQERNDKIVAEAARSNKIVSSLFPSNVRERLFGHEEKKNGKHPYPGINETARMKSFLTGETDGDENGNLNTKPIADLFPRCTVLFADIVGFTAWSSVREPSQVFMLLETLYRAFDDMAKRRRVFKVETIGDCYVAVTGLPEPRKEHATIMTRFARDCMYKVTELTKRMEIVLGPDTGDLSMRFGLHSGPVTAGVLRGERSRFQLFGDTVNTAARMESTGRRGRVHMSSETAEILAASGKSHWVKQREDKVHAKGKGEMTTYWLVIGIEKGSETDSTSSLNSEDDDGAAREEIQAVKASSRDHALPIIERHDQSAGIPVIPLDTPGAQAEKNITEKTARLIDWNVDVLKRLLKQVLARRRAVGIKGTPEDLKRDRRLSMANSGKTVLDEVKEIIVLPKFDAKASKNQEDIESVNIDKAVADQLHDFVLTIATLYRPNSFHNFEHASHVTMSVVKLLSRIVAPSENDIDDAAKIRMSKHRKRVQRQIFHDHTYGITSDPLTQLAVVLSALIHDVDHQGVPNAQLVKENVDIAITYKGKSVAEQNSIVMAWDLFMQQSFTELRAAICSTEAERQRFRELLVNSVLATDIADKELKALRNARWEKAFTERSPGEKEDEDVAVNRKATIVIEHLIQASDVAHTMQHWHVYRKWNERLFYEMMAAYKDGRSDKDPTEFWYKGEIGFFDFYIIPLAKKLKDCGVFGVSSDEYLNYAMKNREEWELRGREVVAEMVAEMKKKEAEVNRPVRRRPQRRLSIPRY